MLTEKRHSYILEVLERDGSVRTSELVKKVGSCVETVRRDLMTLEERGLLRRVHGGAVKRESPPYRKLSERMKMHAEQKAEVARAAASLVREGEVIAVDAGTTAAAFATELAERFSSLTVITYSLRVFELLKDKFTVILSGGEYYPREDCLCGEIAVDTLAGLHADKCFLCPSAVSADHGAEDYVPALISVQKQLVGISDRLVLCADSSKLDTRGLMRISELMDGCAIATDSGIAPETERLFRSAGIKVVTPEPADADAKKE